MQGNCIYIRKRAKKGKTYFYCTKRKAIIELSCCFNCSSKEYKKVAKMVSKTPLKKINKNNKVRQATDIPKKVKLKVWKRDSGICIFCKKPVSWNYANSHFIKRSQLGRGIEQNIMTNCDRCHALFEESIYREKMKAFAKEHLKSKYDDWNEDMLIYKKYN